MRLLLLSVMILFAKLGLTQPVQNVLLSETPQFLDSTRFMNAKGETGKQFIFQYTNYRASVIHINNIPFKQKEKWYLDVVNKEGETIDYNNSVELKIITRLRKLLTKIRQK